MKFDVVRTLPWAGVVVGGAALPAVMASDGPDTHDKLAYASIPTVMVGGFKMATSQVDVLTTFPMLMMGSFAVALGTAMLAPRALEWRRAANEVGTVDEIAGQVEASWRRTHTDVDPKHIEDLVRSFDTYAEHGNTPGDGKLNVVEYDRLRSSVPFR